MNLAHKQKPLTDEAGSGRNHTKENSRDPISVLDAVFHFASQIRIHMTRLDPIGIHRHHAGVVVNPTTGFGDLNKSPRISHRAGFAACARLQWAAEVGRPSGLPVRDCRFANPALRRPSRLATGSGMLNANPEGTMQTLITRALSRLFPIPRRLAFSLYRHRSISALTLVRMIGGAA